MTWLLGGLVWLVVGVVVALLVGRTIRLAETCPTARNRAVATRREDYPHG